MPDAQNPAGNADQVKLPPPSGDSQRAEKYVSELTPLISQGKLVVEHTDLSKYDPSSLHDHYRVDMLDYQLEISHTKAPLTGKDSYVLLFNNLKNIREGCTEKVILAYLILTADQFKKLQDVADEQIETRKKIEEEKRFAAAMTDVDKMLDKIAKGEVDISKSAQPLPTIKTEEEKKKEEKPSEPMVEEVPAATSKLEVKEEEKLAESFPPPNRVVNEAPAEAKPAEQPPPPQPGPVLEGYNLPGVNSFTQGAVFNQTPQDSQPVNPIPIEDVQKILQQTSVSNGSTSSPTDLPSIATLPSNQPEPAPEPIPVANVPASSQKGIDQAIDQAFKPADNSVLSNNTAS
jgi:hypothetical protein